MSTDVALQAMFERFAARFALPLVRGGDGLLVSYPLGPGAANYFVNAQIIDSTVEEDLLEARRSTVKRLVSSTPSLALRDEEIRLLLSLHNVLLATHDELVGGVRGKARWEHCLRWSRAHLRKVSPCRDAQEALARHSLLHHVPELTREDGVVRTRRSSKRYAGQSPPRLALLWPRLRQVETSTAKAPLAEVVPHAPAREALTEILERSPLTCLLGMPYARLGTVHTEALRWSPSVVAVLSRPDVCRAVTYQHLELGFHVVGGPLARAIVLGLEGLVSSPNARDLEVLAFGLRYTINLHLTYLFTTSGEELTGLFERTWSSEHEPYRGLFFGWLAAALARQDRLGAPLFPSGELRQLELFYRQEAARVAGFQLGDATKHVDWIIPAGEVPELSAGGPR